jgi:dTDP-4-amino-4,6-dideoxygalactose transaminase
MTAAKSRTGDLAVFGGRRTFDPPKSIGSLADPDPERLLHWSRIFFDRHQYTNNGPVNRLLEARLAEWHETAHCVTFVSAFWGISLAIRSLAIPGRSEAVMPSLTYRRMGEIVASAGMIPRYCDIEAETLAQSVDSTRDCINDETALILGAHPTVGCCDAAGLEALSAETGIPLLFDSVESAFETTGGRRVGTFGRAEGFSIHATKLINGFEGGYIVTNDAGLAADLKLMRGFGIPEEDQVVCYGMNAKLNEIHAAMAMASLDGLPDLVERNRQRYLHYRELLPAVEGLSLRSFDDSEQTSFKNILVRVDDGWPLSREHTLAALQAEGALARPYYSPALHKHDAAFESRFGALPVSEEVSRRYLLLPCGDQMSLDDISVLVELLSFLARHGAEIAEELSGAGNLVVNTGYTSLAVAQPSGSGSP